MKHYYKSNEWTNGWMDAKDDAHERNTKYDSRRSMDLYLVANTRMCHGDRRHSLEKILRDYY